MVTCNVLGGKKYQHDDSLGPCASTHLISTLLPPRHDMMRLIGGKFRGITAKIGAFVSTQCFVEVDARFRGVLIRNTILDAEWQWTTTSLWEGHQSTIFDIPKHFLCSRKVPRTGVESNGGKLMWKFDDFIRATPIITLGCWRRRISESLVRSEIPNQEKRVKILV